MTEQNVYAIYFSPTETSKKGVLAIASEFGENVNEINMTKLSSKISKTEFNESDLVVFGGPVYSGRLFKGFAKKLSEIKGNNTPCVISVTYGNRDYDDALIELNDIVRERGFVPFAGCALVGQHTFGKVAVGRPNEQDILEDKQFANNAKQFINSEFKLNVKGNRPYRNGGNGGKFTPQTDMELCSNCGYCAKECPVNAIDLVESFKTDSDKCISCFRCINVCPKNARNMDTEEYNNFAVDFTKKLSAKKENCYFLPSNN